MARPKKVKVQDEEVKGEGSLPSVADGKTDAENRLAELESLYKEMQDEGIRSISDLEVKIAQVRQELSKFN